MFNKTLISVLLLALILCLSACGGDASPSSSEPRGHQGTPAVPASSSEAETESAAPSYPDYVIPGKLASDTLYVRKICGVTDDFILGMDISSLLAEEASGVKYYDFDGKETDLLKILADCGINTVRVRVWNDPFDKDGNGYGGGSCTIDTAIEIGKRATAYGIGLLVDFHYSDFWADPAKQMAPKSWEGMSIEDKTQAAYDFTHESLRKLKDAGVKVSMVQLGNETNGKLAGEKTWFNIQYIMGAGAKAMRELYPDALVAVHFANPENAENYLNYASKLAYYSLDYDVFASSYYPYWHGTLENLSSVLSQIAEKYGKKVMVMETSYAYTPEDTDFFGNTIGEGSAVVKNYPYTVQGQANSVQDVIQTIAEKTTNGIGVVYWEGAWISVGTESWEANHEIWEKHGSGWASSYAAAYDPEDAGKYYGGCAVDNQAFFDASGHPLESLKVWNLVRYGNEVTPLADAIEDVTLILDINGDYVLPDTVNAVMTDDSKQNVPVVWNITQEELEGYRAGGPAKYEITGTAAGMEAHLQLSLIEYNFLTNYSFEDGDKGWTVTDLGKADELYVEEKTTDSLTGAKHYHFWSAAQNSVKFTLEQTVSELPAGSYRFEISIMGGDAGETEVYAYAKIDGEIVARADTVITSYNDWHSAVIDKFDYAEGQELVVGIYVQCHGEGNGAWGKIDDAMLNSVAGSKE